MENDEEISKTAGNENQLHVGQKFSSYTELTENIKRYEIFNRQKFYKSRSRTVEAIAKQLKRSLKSSLEYYELEYSCIHGKERGKRGNGLRHTRTVRLGCGAKFKLRIDSSGNYLAITSLNLEHMNHNLSQTVFEHLHQNRQLDSFQEKDIQTYLSLGANKKKIQQKILNDTGKKTTLKDLQNIQYKLKIRQNDLEEAVKVLQTKYWINGANGIMQYLCGVSDPPSKNPNSGMAQIKSSASLERTSIHDMLKETPPSTNENRTNNAVPTVQTNPVCPYSRSVPTGLSSCTSSPAILTPTTPIQNDDSTILKTSSRIENLKNWSISTYKCTKQLMFEKLGKSSRTVDAELESQIEQLRETQKKYSNILRLARALTSHFYHVVQTQHDLGEAFSELAQKSPELQEEFLYNSETQRNLTKNGETLLGALNFFISSVNTLCNKTIEDTLQSIRQYEAARIEYDAYRTDLESMSTKPDGAIGLEEAQQGYELHRQQFMKLRSEVAIKMKFLDENRIKVMHKQLLLFHNAISAYFSGNQQALEATLKQFNIKVKTPNSTYPSWLEQ